MATVATKLPDSTVEVSCPAETYVFLGMCLSGSKYQSNWLVILAVGQFIQTPSVHTKAIYIYIMFWPPIRRITIQVTDPHMRLGGWVHGCPWPSAISNIACSGLIMADLPPLMPKQRNHRGSAQAGCSQGCPEGHKILCKTMGEERFFHEDMCYHVLSCAHLSRLLLLAWDTIYNTGQSLPRSWSVGPLKYLGIIKPHSQDTWGDWLVSSRIDCAGNHGWSMSFLLFKLRTSCS